MRHLEIHHKETSGLKEIDSGDMPSGPADLKQQNTPLRQTHGYYNYYVVATR